MKKFKFKILIVLIITCFTNISKIEAAAAAAAVGLGAAVNVLTSDNPDQVFDSIGANVEGVVGDVFDF